MRALALCVAVWLAVTAFYWVGYVGTDDLFYARYAYLFHRAPINWWEFRMPAILAIRGSFLLLGPSEFAACVPSLLASLAICGSVAWFLGWPRRITWQSTASIILASVLPLDAAFRSLPSANQIAAGLLAVGTVCILKRNGAAAFFGSFLLALAFITHEVSFFYVAIFCVTALLFDPRRYWRPVACCVVLSAALFAAEAATYRVWLGDAFARYRTAANTTARLELGVDPDTGLSGVRFFLWPLQNFVLGKSFGFDLLALLAAGLAAWRLLSREQRIVWVTIFAVFVWLGYGSQVPWAYKPFYRQAQYYTCLTFGVAALLPLAVSLALQRASAARLVIGAAIAVHAATLAVTGGWGMNVDVSRGLLAYAREHPQQRFLTDVNTMNEMYVMNGFRVPDNVICLEGNASKRLLVNKEPPGAPVYHFAQDRVDGILLNLERPKVQGFEREFRTYLQAHEGTHTTIVPARQRLLLRSMPLSAGGQLVTPAPVRSIARRAAGAPARARADGAL